MLRLCCKFALRGLTPLELEAALICGRRRSEDRSREWANWLDDLLEILDEAPLLSSNASEKAAQQASKIDRQQTRRKQTRAKLDAKASGLGRMSTRERIGTNTLPRSNTPPNETDDPMEAFTA